MDEEYITNLFDDLLKIISSQAIGGEELIALWINIARKMGVNLYLPHFRVVVVSDEYDNRSIVGMVGCLDHEILDDLCSERVFTKGLLEKSLQILDDEVEH